MGDKDAVQQLNELGATIHEMEMEKCYLPDCEELDKQFKELRSLQQKCKKEALSKVPRDPAPTVTVTYGGSKDTEGVLLPALHFSGRPAEWQTFWEDFINILGLRPSLTDSQHLRDHLDCQEAQDIMANARIDKVDFAEASRCLIKRFDQPRDTCLVVLQEWIDYQFDHDHSGLEDSYTRYYKAVGTMKQFTDLTVPTLMGLMWLLKFPLPMFHECRRTTSKDFHVPAGEGIAEFVEKYRGGLVTDNGCSASLPMYSEPAYRDKREERPPRRRQAATPALHIGGASACKLCGDSGHTLLQGLPTLQLLLARAVRLLTTPT